MGSFQTLVLNPEYFKFKEEWMIEALPVALDFAFTSFNLKILFTHLLPSEKKAIVAYTKAGFIPLPQDECFRSNGTLLQSMKLTKK